MPCRQSRLGFVACAIFIAGFWAPMAAAKPGGRTLRSPRPIRGVKVVVIKNAFVLGAWSGNVRRAKGLAIDESGIREGRELELSLSAHPRRLFFEGVRPFVDAAVEIDKLKPEGFVRSGGGRTIARSTRWRMGGGLAIPLQFASTSLNIEPSLHYAVTRSRLSNRSFWVDLASGSFTSHAIQMGLGAVIPIGELGPIKLSLGLGARALIPVARSDSARSNFAANTKIEIQGGFGIRANFTGLFGQHF